MANEAIGRQREMAIQSFKDLKVWQHGIELSLQSYRATSSFPNAETFGLVSQIRRSSASIPANIAEGWGRSGTKEFVQFLHLAQGSLSELETHLILARRLEYLDGITAEKLSVQTDQLSKMLYALIRSLQRKMALKK